jgi:uncharacterized protein (TIGR03067 family)
MCLSVCIASPAVAESETGGDSALLDGWWKVVKVEMQGKSMDTSDTITVSFRKKGKLYIMNSLDCKVKQSYQQELDVSKVPFTGRTIAINDDLPSYFTFSLDKDQLIFAAYRDERKHHESPPDVTLGDNIRLIHQLRISDIRCAEPGSDSPISDD